MLEQILDQENYKELIGVRYPTIFIDKIRIARALGDTGVPEAYASCFCLFEIPVGFTEEQVADLKGQLTSLTDEIYIGPAFAPGHGDYVFSENKFHLMINDEGSPKTFQNPFAFIPSNPERQGGVHLGYNEYIIPASDLFSVESQEIYNTSGKKFLLFYKEGGSGEGQLRITLSDDFVKYNNLDIIAFCYDKDVFNDLSNNKDSTIENILNNTANDLDILRAKKGKISYEPLLVNGKINKENKSIFIDSQGSPYVGPVMYSLSNTYHKTNTDTKKLFADSVKTSIESFLAENIIDKQAQDLADSLLTTLETFRQNEKLLYFLDKQNRSTIVKTTALPVGNLFKKVDGLLTEANRALMGREELTKQIVANSKIIDEYTTAAGYVTIDGNTSSPSDDDIIYKPITARRLIVPSEEYARKLPFEYLWNGVIIENRSLFFMDDQKALAYKSKLSKFLDIDSLGEMLGGTKTLFQFFTKQSVTVSRGLLGDVDMNDIENGKNGYLKLTNRAFTTEAGLSVAAIPAADSDFLGVLETKNSGTTQVHFPDYGIVADFTGEANLPVEVGVSDSFISTILAERNWDLPPLTLNEGFFSVDQGGYRLSTYEITDLQSSQRALYGDERLQFYFIQSDITDNTAYFYDEFIRKPFESAIELYRDYYDAATDFCSSNMTTHFNDFFIKSIEAKYSGTKKPWEVGVFFYVYMSNLIAASWDEGENQRRYDRKISIESCREQVNRLLTEISPKSGNEQSVIELLSKLERLYYDYFAFVPFSAVGRYSDIYSFFTTGGADPTVNTTYPLRIAVKYELTRDIQPTAELIDFAEVEVAVEVEGAIETPSVTDGGTAPRTVLLAPEVVAKALADINEKLAIQDKEEA